MRVSHPRHCVVTLMTAPSVLRQCFTNCMTVSHPRNRVVTLMTASYILQLHTFMRLKRSLRSDIKLYSVTE